MKRKIFIGSVIALLAVIAVAAIVFYPAIRFMTQKETVELGPGLTVMLGGGGNSGVVVGDSSVVVIDTKMMGNGEDLYTLARGKAGQKPIIVINTHYHPDHVQGNKYFNGSRIYIGNYGREFLRKNIDAENQPTDFVQDSLLIDIGNEKVGIYDLGQGHTTHDVVVCLIHQNVLFTGDLVFNQINPVLKSESGARVSGWIHLLESMLGRWGGCKVVPGHGPIGGRELIETMHQYFS